MVDLRCTVAVARLKNQTLIVCFVSVIIILNGGLLSGCSLLENIGESFTILSDQSGVLVIGRDDTLYGSGNYAGRISASGICKGVAPSPILISLDTIHARFCRSEFHRRRVSCVTYFDWKIWLVGGRSQVPGSYIIPIEGARFTLHVIEENAFLIQVDPDSQVQIQGRTMPYTVSLIRSTGFTAPVQCSLYQPPSGITAAFNPSSVTGDTSFMDLTVDDVVPPGLKSLEVMGTGGTVTRRASLSVDVVPASYVVTLSPGSLTLSQGQIGTAIVRVASQFLPATLSEVTTLPAYVTTSFSPNPTLSTSTMTVSAGPQAQAGTYKIAIAGTFSNGHVGRDTLTVTITPSSGGWATAHTTTAQIYGLSFSDDLGVAVGRSGITLRSSDRGQTWTEAAGISQNLTWHDVALIGTHAVAVSGNGIAWVSNDAGATWTGHPTGGFQEMYGIALSDLGNGLAVGDGRIYRTTNGGNNWARVPLIDDPYAFRGVAYRFNLAIVVGWNTSTGDGVIFRSTDYGEIWNSQNFGTNILRSVSMADVNNGIIVGDGGTVLTTTDGGQNWVQRTVVSNGFQSTYMLNAQRATVGGFNVIYQTVNGGQTWLQDANSTQMNPVWDIHIFEDNTAVCVGGNGNGSAFLRRQ